MTFKHDLFFCGQYVTVFGPKDPEQATRLFIKYVASQLGEDLVSLGYLYQLSPYYSGKVDGRAYIAFTTLRYFLQLSYKTLYVLPCDEFFSQSRYSCPVPPPMRKRENSHSPNVHKTPVYPPNLRSDTTTSSYEKLSKLARWQVTSFLHKFGEVAPTITFLLVMMGVFGSVAAALI